MTTDAQSAELLGWAAVAERVMCEAAQRVIAEVDEPRGRAAIEATWASSLGGLVGNMVAAVAHASVAQAAERQRVEMASVHSDVAALRAERSALEGELRLLERRHRSARAEAAEAAAAVQEELDGIRKEVRVAQGKLAQIHAERSAAARELAEVWDYLHAVSSPSDTTTDEPLPAKAHRVCARLLECEEERGLLRDRLAAMEEALAAADRQLRGQHMDHPSLQAQEQAAGPFAIPATAVEGRATEAMLPIEAPRPSYERVLPTPTVNPVTASLLRVRAQVRRLREASREPLGGSCVEAGASGVVQSPQPAPAVDEPLFSRAVYMQTVTPVRRPRPRESITREDGAHTDRDTTSAADVTPSGAPHVPSLSGSPAPALAPPPSAWRERMSELQMELRGLRQDLGGVRRS